MAYVNFSFNRMQGFIRDIGWIQYAMTDVILKNIVSNYTVQMGDVHCRYFPPFDVIKDSRYYRRKKLREVLDWITNPKTKRFQAH